MMIFLIRMLLVLWAFCAGGRGSGFGPPGVILTEAISFPLAHSNTRRALFERHAESDGRTYVFSKEEATAATADTNTASTTTTTTTSSVDLSLSEWVPALCPLDTLYDVSFYVEHHLYFYAQPTKLSSTNPTGHNECPTLAMHDVYQTNHKEVMELELDHEDDHLCPMGTQIPFSQVLQVMEKAQLPVHHADGFDIVVQNCASLPIDAFARLGLYLNAEDMQCIARNLHRTQVLAEWVKASPYHSLLVNHELSWEEEGSDHDLQDHSSDETDDQTEDDNEDSDEDKENLHLLEKLVDRYVIHHMDLYDPNQDTYPPPVKKDRQRRTASQSLTAHTAEAYRNAVERNRRHQEWSERQRAMARWQFEQRSRQRRQKEKLQKHDAGSRQLQNNKEQVSKTFVFRDGHTIKTPTVTATSTTGEANAAHSHLRKLSSMSKKMKKKKKKTKKPDSDNVHTLECTLQAPEKTYYTLYAYVEARNSGRVQFDVRCGDEPVVVEFHEFYSEGVTLVNATGYWLEFLPDTIEADCASHDIYVQYSCTSPEPLTIEVIGDPGVIEDASVSDVSCNGFLTHAKMLAPQYYAIADDVSFFWTFDEDMPTSLGAGLELQCMNFVCPNECN